MEALMELVGPFGKFQKFSLFLIGFLAALSSMTIFSTIFIAAKPKLLCTDLFEDSYSGIRGFESNFTANDTKNEVDVCVIWANLTKYDDKGVLSFNSSRYMCSFDRTYYGSTIITDWGLICDRKVLAGLTQTFYMIGSLCAIFSGYFGDRYGRKRSTMIFLYLLSFSIIIGEILQIKALNINIYGRYIIYSITQFLIGSFVNCVYISSYVLLLELTTHRYHTIFSNIKLYIYIFGELLAMIISYFAKDWHVINYTLAGFSLLTAVLLGILLPESPRWLVSQKRYRDAFNSIKKVDWFNARILKVESFDENVKDDDSFFRLFSIKEHKDLDNLDIGKTEKTNFKEIFKGIFTPKSMLIKTVLVSYMWIVVSLLYYGVSLGITGIDQVNPYVIYLFQCLAEAIGYTICLVNDKLGRRRTNIFYFVVGGLACLSVSLVPRNTDLNDSTKVLLDAVLIISLTSIGKCMVSAAFNTCFIYSTELYPTYVRNFVVLFFSCIGRIGSLISPQINLLGDSVWKPLPYLLYSILSIIAGVFVFLLPETHHSSGNGH